MVAEIVPAALYPEEIAPTVVRVPRCLIGVENLSGLRVVDMREIATLHDDLNVIFNPEGA